MTSVASRLFGWELTLVVLIGLAAAWSDLPFSLLPDRRDRSCIRAATSCFPGFWRSVSRSW